MSNKSNKNERISFRTNKEISDTIRTTAKDLFGGNISFFINNLLREHFAFQGKIQEDPKDLTLALVRRAKDRGLDVREILQAKLEERHSA